MAFKNTKDNRSLRRDRDGARSSDLHLELSGPQDAKQTWSEKCRADAFVFSTRPRSALAG